MAAEVPADPLWFQQRVLRVLADRAEAGSLHGLPLHAFDLVREAQAAFRLLQSGRNLGKVVLRVGIQHTNRRLGMNFDALSSRLLEHTEASVRTHDAVQLGAAYALLERLCQQYVQAALQELQGQAVPRWRHQLLLNWCKSQPPPPEPYVTREEVLQAHPDLWPEVSSPASNHGPSPAPTCCSLLSVLTHPPQALFAPLSPPAGGSGRAMRRSARRCADRRRAVPGVALPRRFDGRRATRVQGRRGRPLLQRVHRGCGKPSSMRCPRDGSCGSWRLARAPAAPRQAYYRRCGVPALATPSRT
eukprot:scaffold89924_cov93-Phaeocystis_antarctica.AAC.1